MAEPSKDGLYEAAKRLEDRSYKTYKARLQAYQRLSRRNNSWNASLIALSTSTTIASVGLLVNVNMYGVGGNALMVALAILSLVASLVVSSVNYSSRSRSMEACYKRIQRISLAAEKFADNVANESASGLSELQKDYDMVVDSTENHLEADYCRSQGKFTASVFRDTLVSFAPYVTLILPIGLVVQFAMWFVHGL